MTNQQGNGATAPSIAPVIQFATALKGARPFKFHNVSDTYLAPILLADGSQRQSYLKDLPPKELANELMAATLASVIGLPSPAAYLVKVSPSVLALAKGPTFGTDRLAFATADVQLPSILQLIAPDLAKFPAIVQRLLQWPFVGLLYGFDSYVANIDRNPGNLLLGSANDVIAIDHGRCFTGPQWMSVTLQPTDPYQDRLKEWLTPQLDQLTRTACLAQAGTVPARLGNHSLSDLAQANYVDDFLSGPDFAALLDFLNNRKVHVPAIAAVALG